jgi:hypothetical protein
MTVPQKAEGGHVLIQYEYTNTKKLHIHERISSTIM